MFPTAYATATETDANAFLVVPEVLDVTSERQSTQGTSVHQPDPDWIRTVKAHKIDAAKSTSSVC